MASNHEMQHPDSPTWCRHCGTFDIACDTTDCVPDRSGRFDASKPEAFVRIFTGLFGSPAAGSQEGKP